MNRLTEEEKAILQEEVIKITDILEKKDLSDDKRKYLNDLKKYMADKMRGLRKPVKNAEKEKMLKSVCDKILKNRLKKTLKNQKLPTIPEYKGGKKKSMSRKTRKNKH
jgi:glutamyl-tRNA reductase